LTAHLSSPSELLYLIFRHRFHELLAEGDLMTALQFLSTHLREHRRSEDFPGDFDKLCLSLVGAASPTHASQLPDPAASTAHILEAIDRELKSCDCPLIETAAPPHRLLTLLGQAVAFQYGGFPPELPTATLLSDFRPAVLPSGKGRELPCATTVKSVRFVDGGNLLLAGAGDRVGMWSAETGEHCGDLCGHRARVWSVAVAGQIAATGSADGTVRLWSVSEKVALANLVGHRGDIYSVDIVGRRVVSGGCDQAVVVWDTETGSPEVTLKGHSEAVTAVLLGGGGSVVM
jgi:hypothetical protein